MIIGCLEDGPRRFSELQVPLRNVTPKVLTQTLRAMERDGLITRAAYAEIPPRVEYELTDLGRTLYGPITACRTWAKENLPTLLAAREAWARQRGLWIYGCFRPDSLTGWSAGRCRDDDT
ncbi:helix-turn-helix transcriptional regulator [Nocardia amamiensis]|uniref:Helix-turn-helix transcriptional regulator n=1 Tax=Nocardia amamiensis TaxID=404578 RepID=A0ABS0D214_9NOCA|nr:helix-turn-helix transcriptional regulator [Nocardia amamiensis]